MMTTVRMWEILGIEPTHSKREIQRAYAAQARLCHPEEDPERFAELKDAYREALQCARNEMPEPEKEKGHVPGRPEEDPSVPSLLSRLDRAEQEKIRASRKQGALRRLTELLEDSREGKRQEAWREYFLSEDFLKEQYEEEFGKGLRQCVDAWKEERPEESDFLRAFMTELAIAYGFFTEADGQVNTEGSFYARQAAGAVWNSYIREQSYDMEQVLDREENLVRQRSFSDYLTLRNMNWKGYLTEKEKEIWENILQCAQIGYLYERKSDRTVCEETRSECIIQLYTHWLLSEPVPACVCRYMYQKYGFHDLEHSSGYKLYAGLKEAVLLQYPGMEEELYGEASKAQLTRSWYQELMRIVLDYQACHLRREYEETGELQERIQALFERREWPMICYEPELFEQMYLQLAGRKVIPPSLAEKLCAFYMEDGSWTDPEQVQFMLEALVSSLSFHRNLLEMDERREYFYEKTSVSDIAEDNRDFWEYFLETGFGCRYVTVIGSSQRQAEYILRNKEYLPGYMKAVYLPSMEWRKRFVGFDEEKDAITKPVSVECPAPGGRILRIEFHLHYVQYFLDEEKVIYPLLSFDELLKEMKEFPDTVHFFFLLAITRICEEERAAAERVIREWLGRLSLQPATVAFLAKALAADNGGNRMPDSEAKRIHAVYYEEQERFCFKAEVSMRNVKIYRQTELGWEEFQPLEGEGKAVKSLDLEGKKQFALNKLRSLRQPDPVQIASFSLEGMDNEKKMLQIIEALKQQEQYRKWGKRSVPYMPGFPWTPGEIMPSVREFFAKDGGWMLESYVVLHMGRQNRKCFERVFYSAMNIFGFDLYFQSPKFAEICRQRTEALHQKIKEKHLVVGRFGWSRRYVDLESCNPLPFAVGESGTFYACDFQQLYQADSLAGLMTLVYDFSQVSRVDIYAGRLSVSRFDHTLEYCYTEEDFQNYLNSKKQTLPDLFTKFGI